MWKFQDFSVTQILREINLGSRILKFYRFCYFRVHWYIPAMTNVYKFIKTKFRASQCVKMADFDALDSPTFDFT